MKLVAQTPIKNFLLVSFGIVMGALIWGGALNECTVAQAGNSSQSVSTSSAGRDNVNIARSEATPCGNDRLVGHRQTSWGESQVVCQDETGRQYNTRQYP